MGLGGGPARGWHRQDRLRVTHSHTVTHKWYASRPPTPTLTPSASSCPNVVLPMPNSKGAEHQELEVPSVSAMCPAAKLVQDQALLATQPPGQPPDIHDSDTGCLRCAPRPRPRASKPRQYASVVILSHSPIPWYPTGYLPYGNPSIPKANNKWSNIPPPVLPHLFPPMLLLPSFFSLFLHSMSMILLPARGRGECVWLGRLMRWSCGDVRLFCRVPSLAVCPLARRVQRPAVVQVAFRGECLTLPP